MVAVQDCQGLGLGKAKVEGVLGPKFRFGAVQESRVFRFSGLAVLGTGFDFSRLWVGCSRFPVRSSSLSGSEGLGS